MKKKTSKIRDEEYRIVFDGCESARMGTVERCGMAPVNVYDFDKLVELHMEEEHGSMSREDAIDFISYNFKMIFYKKEDE